jgi:hypothetical protein
MIRWTLVVLALIAFAAPAFAVMNNMGLDLPMPQDPNQLTPPELRQASMLYAPSESDDPAYRAAIAQVMGGTCDYFNASTGTPSLALLSTYDCVYVWANYAFFDYIGYGNVLADYVDGGGTVILGAFCTYTMGNYLGGRIMTSGYCPVVSPSGSNHFMSSTYAGDGTSCIYEGVSYFECTYRDYLVTQGGGIVDGHFADQEIAHAYRPDMKVFYSNGSGASQLACMGEWALCVGNACECSLGPIAVQKSTWGRIKSIFE